jgi:hypothetical protein
LSSPAFLHLLSSKTSSISHFFALIPRDHGGGDTKRT